MAAGRRPNTILVLQVCGWFHSNFKGFQHNMLTAFNESKKRIGGPDWGKQIVVVSSNIGHENCHAITATQKWPLTTGVNYTGEPHRYGWNNIHMLNGMAEQMVKEIGGTFLDITTMLSYRPDGHIEADCGHWCLPGPYDVAATLLEDLGRVLDSATAKNRAAVHAKRANATRKPALRPRGAAPDTADGTRGSTG